MLDKCSIFEIVDNAWDKIKERVENWRHQHNQTEDEAWAQLEIQPVFDGGYNYAIHLASDQEVEKYVETDDPTYVDTIQEWFEQGHSVTVSREILEDEPGCERPIPFEITITPDGEESTIYNVQ